MKIQYFYLLKEVIQLGLDKINRKEEVPVGDGHIVISDSFLCGTNRDTLKRKYGTKKSTTRISPLRNVPLCAGCEKSYKENPNPPWKKWTRNVEKETNGTTH